MLVALDNLLTNLSHLLDRKIGQETSVFSPPVFYPRVANLTL